MFKFNKKSDKTTMSDDKIENWTLKSKFRNMIYISLDDKIKNLMSKSKLWKYDLQFKQKRNNKQDSAYIRHREEWKWKKGRRADKEDRRSQKRK